MKPEHSLESVNNRIEFYQSEIDKLQKKEKTEYLIELNQKLLNFWFNYKKINYA